MVLYTSFNSIFTKKQVIKDTFDVPDFSLLKKCLIIYIYYLFFISFTNSSYKQLDWSQTDF